MSVSFSFLFFFPQVCPVLLELESLPSSRWWERCWRNVGIKWQCWLLTRPPAPREVTAHLIQTQLRGIDFIVRCGTRSKFAFEVVGWYVKISDFFPLPFIYFFYSSHTVVAQQADWSLSLQDLCWVIKLVWLSSRETWTLSSGRHQPREHSAVSPERPMRPSFSVRGQDMTLFLWRLSVRLSHLMANPFYSG